MVSGWTKGTVGANSGTARTLDTTSAAPTVEIVWPFRLLKISLVAVVLILLTTTVTREPGVSNLFPLRVFEGLLQDLLDVAIDTPQ